MNLSAKKLLHILYYGIEEMPRWNPTILESRVLKVSVIVSNVVWNLVN